MMAMNDPSSGQGEWVQFYHRTPTGGAAVAPRAMSMFGQAPAVSEATVVTTTVASPSIPSPILTGPGTAMGTHTHTHSPDEGPGGRAVRKRGRAARRAPTTVLNTDLNNFRALVQQYTGARTAPFSSMFRPDVRVANFGFDNHPALNAMIIRPQRTQFYHQQQQQHQHIQQLHQGEEGMFPMGQACDVFLSDSNNSISNMEVSDEFLKSMSSQNGHIGSGGYMF